MINFTSIKIESAIFIIFFFNNIRVKDIIF